MTTGLSSGIAAAWIHTNNNCASGTSQGSGLLEKVKGLGKVWILSDNFEAKNYGIYTEQLFYTFNRRFTKWTLWISLSGITGFEANSGVLESAGAHGATSHGTTSTVAKVARLVATRRQ
ncbi:MAG: hypothetical protein ACREHF_15555 [Rhizomicrobium sp.]